MLTPQEISDKEFTKAIFGGYDMSAVDDFLETLTGDYSALYKENAILKSKIKVLVEKVEEYRSTDDAMRMALLTAQKLGDEITTDAKKKSADMLNQTELDIRDRLNEMKNKFAEEDARLKSIKDETRKFVKASQEIMRHHAGFLSKIEELNRSVETEGPAPSYMPEPITQADDEDDDDEISDTAKQIEESLFLTTDADDDADPFAALLKDDETTKLFRLKKDPEAPKSDDPTSPRPKFDFNNLKFGHNYSDE